MLKLTDRGTAHTCDGITRRDFLQVGALGAIGLSLPQLGSGEGAGAGQQGGRRPLGDHDFQSRRAEPDGYVRSQARRGGRDSRAVQADFDRAATFRSPRSCRGTPRSPTSSRSCGRAITPRRRCTTPASRCCRPAGSSPAASTRRTSAARWPICAGRKTDLPPHVILPEADGADRRQHAARSGRRIPRQGVRPVRAERRSEPSRISRCPTCCRRRRSARSGSSAAGELRQIVDDRVARVRGQPQTPS